MPDLIQFECPSCAAILRIPLEMSGSQGPCPICAHEIVAPNAYTGAGAYEPGAESIQQTLTGQHHSIPSAEYPPQPPAEVPQLPEPAVTRLEPVALSAERHPEVPSPKTSKSPFSDLAAVRVIDPSSATPKGAAHSYRKMEASSPPATEHAEEPLPQLPDPAPSSAFIPMPSPDAGPVSKPGRSSKAGWIALCGLIAIICLVGGFLLGNTLKQDPSPSAPFVVPAMKPKAPLAEPTPPLPTPPATDTTSTKPETKPTAEAPKAPEPTPPLPAAEPKKVVAEAEATLRAFLEAPDWKTRSSYVLSADTLRPKMEIYAKNNSDGPTPFESFAVKHSQVDEKSGSTLLVFQVDSSAAPAGIPVAVLETTSGWLVDWESFVEFRDDHFKHFTEGPSDLVGEFHLIVSNPPPSADIPQENENFGSYLVAPPLPDRQRTAFVKKSNPAYAALKAATAEGHIFTPVLEVSKRSLPDGRGYLEILSIKATDWRPRETKP